VQNDKFQVVEDWNFYQWFP